MNSSELAMLIGDARRRAGLSLTELAERIGVHRAQIARWEKGRCRHLINAWRLRDWIELGEVAMPPAGSREEAAVAPTPESSATIPEPETTPGPNVSAHAIEPCAGCGFRFQQMMTRCPVCHRPQMRRA